MEIPRDVDHLVKLSGTRSVEITRTVYDTIKKRHPGVDNVSLLRGIMSALSVAIYIVTCPMSARDREEFDKTMIEILKLQLKALREDGTLDNLINGRSEEGS